MSRDQQKRCVDETAIGCLNTAPPGRLHGRLTGNEEISVINSMGFIPVGESIYCMSKPTEVSDLVAITIDANYFGIIFVVENCYTQARKSSRRNYWGYIVGIFYTPIVLYL